MTTGDAFSLSVKLMQMLREDLRKRHEIDREMLAVLRDMRDELAHLRTRK